MKQILFLILGFFAAAALACGQKTEKAVLTRISEQSFVEGGTPNVLSLDKDIPREI